MRVAIFVLWTVAAAHAQEKPRDAFFSKDVDFFGTKKKAPPAPKEPPPPKVIPDSTPIDLTVELVDKAGNVARLPLSKFGIARRPLDVRVYRRDGRDAQRFSNIAEMIPQTFMMPVAEFAKTSSQFDPRQLKTIRLVFDRTVAGTVVLEDVGISTPVDPAFLGSRLQ